MSLIARLIEAGTPAELIEEVAMLVAEKRALDSRRAADRERKQTQRARDKGDSHVTSRDVTGQDVTSEDNPSLSRPPLSSPQTPQQTPPTHTHPEKHTPRARKGHRLPDDWEPKVLSGEIAQSVTAWPAGAIERELARFRDWAASATGPNAVKKDWDAAWRNWLRKADDEGRYRHNGTANRNDCRPRDNRDGVAIALDRQLGFDDAPRAPGRRDAGPGDGDRRGPAAALADLR